MKKARIKFYNYLEYLFSDEEDSQKRWEIASAIRSSKKLANYDSKKTSIRNDLLYKINALNYIHENVVVGDSLITQILKKFSPDRIITDKTAYSAFSERFGQLFVEKYFIDEISGKELQQIIEENKAPDNFLLGIGGGRVMDYLKFIQMQTNNFTVAIPTSLASHVYASPKIHALPAIKELGYERTIDGPVPDLVLLDIPFLEELRQYNPRLIRAGLGGILAFITAVKDWKLAEKHCVAKTSKAVLDMSDYIIDQLGKFDVERPLSEWIEDYSFIQVLLCNITGWVGSAPASGSEHLFALAAEDGLENKPLHGELVALGTIIMSYVQGNDYKAAAGLVKKLQLPTYLSKIGITVDQAVAALQNCKEIGKKKGRFTVVDTLEMDEGYCRKVIDRLIKEDIIKE